MLDTMRIEATMEAKEIGIFRTTLVLKLLGKAAGDKSYLSICEEFYAKCFNLASPDHQVPSPFQGLETEEKTICILEDSQASQASAAKPKAEKTKGASSQDATQNLDTMIIEYDEDGKPKHVSKFALAAKGFVEGAIVGLKKDDGD